MPPVIIPLGILFGLGVASFVAPSIFVGLAAFLFKPLLILSGIGLLGEINKLISGRPEFQRAAQSRLITAREPNPHWRIIIGQVRTGGVITFLQTSGTNNEFLHLIITLAGHPVESIDTMYFDGEAVPIDASGNATGTYAGLVFVRKHLGDPNDATQPFPELAAALPAVWTSQHLQRGRAKVYVRLKFDAQKFQGIPNITFDVKGAQVLDPRTGNTQFSNNPALILNWYLTHTQFGMAVPQTRIDSSALIAAANVCDELVPLRAGGSEKRYTANGVFDTQSDHGQVIRALIESMAGDLIFSGGMWIIHAGSFRSATTTLTDKDFVRPMKIQSRLGEQEIFNTVKGSFISPNRDWQPTDFPSKTSTQYQTEDGRVIFTDIQLPFTTSHATAQRLAKIMLESARRMKTVQVSCRLSAMPLQAGDTVAITHERFGWNGKMFKVLEWSLEADTDENDAPVPIVNLTLREWDAGIYTWNPNTDEELEIVPTFSSPVDPRPLGRFLDRVEDDLDDIVDGVQFRRVRSAALDATGNVDLASSGVVNKQLDHIADGTIYARTRASVLSDGRVRFLRTSAGQDLDVDESAQRAFENILASGRYKPVRWHETAIRERAIVNRTGSTSSSTFQTLDFFDIFLPAEATAYKGNLSLSVTNAIPPNQQNLASSAVNLAGTGVDWVNPNNVTASDNLYATAVLSAFGFSDTLEISFPAFNIPPGSTIRGIELLVERSKTGSGDIRDSNILLIRSGNTSGDRSDVNDPWIGIDTTKIYGGPNDLWGLTGWNETHFNTPGATKVRISVIEEGGTSGATARIDAVSLRVYFGEYVAEARLKIGNQTSNVISVVAPATSAGPTSVQVSGFTVPAPPNNKITVEVQARMASGTGTATPIFEQVRDTLQDELNVI